MFPVLLYDNVFVFSDPAFVGSAHILGSDEGGDDQIYFFFSEMGKEFDFFDNTIVSRIARVCKVMWSIRAVHTGLIKLA